MTTTWHWCKTCWINWLLRIKKTGLLTGILQTWYMHKCKTERRATKRARTEMRQGEDMRDRISERLITVCGWPSRISLSPLTPHQSKRFAKINLFPQRWRNPDALDQSHQYSFLLQTSLTHLSIKGNMKEGGWQAIPKRQCMFEPTQRPASPKWYL